MESVGWASVLSPAWREADETVRTLVTRSLIVVLGNANEFDERLSRHVV